MSAIAELERKLSDVVNDIAKGRQALDSRIKEIRLDLIALRQKPEPCPLEEGKSVRICLNAHAVLGTDLNHCEVRLLRTGTGGANIVISSRWSYETALEKARELITKHGDVKVD